MTKERQNEIIKEAWVRRLQSDLSIPDSIGETYSAWLQGKIKQASDQLTAIGQAKQQQQLDQAQSGGEEENAA